MRPLMEAYAEALIRLCKIRINEDVKELYDKNRDNEIITSIEAEIAKIAGEILNHMKAREECGKGNW